MSQIYAATHRNSRRFAIKVIDPRIAADPARLELAIKHAYLANAILRVGSRSELAASAMQY